MITHYKLFVRYHGASDEYAIRYSTLKEAEARYLACKLNEETSYAEIVACEQRADDSDILDDETTIAMYQRTEAT